MSNKWFKTTDDINFISNIKNIKSLSLSTTYQKPKHITCFSHVPKTGGTSLESILAKNFLLSEVVHVNAPDLNKQPGLLDLKKNLPRLICGHHPIHGLLYHLLPSKPMFHFTLLRHPIDRVLSYYNYVMGKKDHPMHNHAKGKSLSEFLQSEPSPEISNGQSKRFSGYLHNGDADDETLFLVSQRTLKQCFSLVLTTCLFDEGLLLLKNHLGLKDIFYQKHNVSKRFVSRAQLSDSELSMIESMNQADLQLFHWARAQCLSLIEAELSSNDVNILKANNLRWTELIQA